MVDNVTLDPGAGGVTLATDEISAVHFQRVKITFGADGVATDVSASNQLPAVVTNAGTFATQATLQTSTNEIGNVKNSGTFVVQSTLQAGTAEIGKLAAGVAEIGNVKNSGTFVVQATLAAETTKVIGTVNISAGQSVAVTNTGTFATQATLQTGTNEIGNVKNSGTFAVQATLSAETTKVIGTVNIAAAQTIAVTNTGTFATQATLQTGSNLVGDVGIGVRTSGGTSIFRSIDLDEGTLEVVKASAGQIYWIHAINLGAAVRFVKIYNATSGTIGTGTPVLTLPIPSQGDTNGAGFMLQVTNGIEFSAGISIGASTGIADSDTGAPGTNEVVVNLGFA